MNNSFYSDLVANPEIKIMGILNVTPDSFSDGGKYYSKIKATERALQMLDDGADIIDIGGESSRPGASPVSVNEEIDRTIPVIENILDQRKDAIISIDTIKPEVAELALQNGAKIVNDISAFANMKLLEIVKKYSAALVIMHMQGSPSTMQNDPKYNNVVEDVYKFLYEKAEIAKSNGVEQLILDPGIGFGKSGEDNFMLLKNLKKFTKLQLPILIGVSKKSLIGKSLNLPLEKREIASVILETVSINSGAKIIRTHNVKNGMQIKKLINYINTPNKLA
ncbi:MAG: dihydropteroate synthase [Chlorobi bacterium]|nr:dihydropteroate synthase [Chlorobiota bacterium]